MATGRRLWTALSEPGSWTPRRPRPVGALLGLGGGLLVTGGGVLTDLLHNASSPYLLSLGVPLAVVLLGLPLLLGVSRKRHLAGLLLLVVFLLVMVPYGFRSAVLDLRGEHVRATVTEVRQGRDGRTGGATYACEVLDERGRSSWLRGSERCGREARPGDRYEILRDPEDLVGASTSDPLISFPVLVAYVCGALLLMAVIGAQAMDRQPARRTPRGMSRNRPGDPD
ncbi:hypothetical protein [Streptomyces halstedii]|uniref:hypothetical protein n=1 Tax=Streptomyces halstedii TaxID=1944 RepID=UPI00194557A5|nr:hypothetical protein [Streptomyces halstedii]